jgi:site-specific DNA-methyltransferase (adenine-specific)
MEMGWNASTKYEKQRTTHSPYTKTNCPLQMAFKNYANEGDKILDTHLGSGSIAIACHDMGFDLTACELDPDYYNAAIKRLTDHQKQLKLL